MRYYVLKKSIFVAWEATSLALESTWGYAVGERKEVPTVIKEVTSTSPNVLGSLAHHSQLANRPWVVS